MDPKYYIVDKVFGVQTVEEALRSRESIEMFGTPSTGFKQYDDQLVGSYTTCYLPIAKLAKIHEQGYHLAVLNREDCKTIYICVQYYLEKWMEIIRNNLNRVTIPYDILYQLDRFAHLVYPSASNVFNTNVDPGDALSRWMEQFQSECDIGSLEVVEDKNIDPETGERPVRTSLQEEIMQHQARRMK